MVEGPFLSPAGHLAFWGCAVWESAAQSPQHLSSLPGHTAKQGTRVKEKGSWVCVYDLRERNNSDLSPGESSGAWCQPSTQNTASFLHGVISVVCVLGTPWSSWPGRSSFPGHFCQSDTARPERAPGFAPAAAGALGWSLAIAQAIARMAPRNNEPQGINTGRMGR